jgi:hypothetical protein
MDMEQFVGTTQAGINTISDAEYWATIDDDVVVEITDDTDFACRQAGCPSIHCPECGACDYDVNDPDGPCNIIMCHGGTN